jgi:hypothetical protein
MSLERLFGGRRLGPVFLLPIFLTIFFNPTGFQCLPQHGGADREVDMMASLSLPNGLNGYLPLTADRQSNIWPMNSRLRRAVSMIRLKKNVQQNTEEFTPEESQEIEENDGLESVKRAMSMMRLRRNNPKVSLFRLRRTPVSMLRLRRRISQLRLKKDAGTGSGNVDFGDCEFPREICEEIMNRAKYEEYLAYNNNNNDNNENDG